MTTYHTFEGKCKWAQIYKPDKYEKLSIQFFPTEEDRKAIKALGTRLTLKEDDDGFFYSFRRDPARARGPLKITGPDGQPFTKLIGNGSKVKVDIEVYDFNHPQHGAGKGHRLNAVQVLDLVEYVKPEVNAGADPDQPPVEPEAAPALAPKKKGKVGWD